MAVDFVPLHDRILVQRIEEQVTTRAGLVIPDTAKEKPQEGEVLAVGNGKINQDGKVIPLEVKPNDRIVFGRYAGTDIVVGGEDYLIMREEEVLGILPKAGKKAKEAA